MGELFSLGMQPLANKYPENKAEASHEFKQELVLYFCDQCIYINLPCDAPRDVFFEDYYYLSSVNEELKNHFVDFAQWVKEANFDFVVDVGSNDGIFLRPLKERGIKCVGVDPSENVSAIANQLGFNTLTGFFDKNICEEILKKYGRPDLISASSVFTHLEDPSEFFKCADNLLSDDGKVVIEVEYLADIIEQFAFERFYFDRPHYFSINTLQQIAQADGFTLERVDLIPVHGGSIRATFSRIGRENSTSEFIELISTERASLTRGAVLAGFKSFQEHCNILKRSIEAFTQKGLAVAAYGCPARFSTITNFSNLDASHLSFVIDDSPLKQGRLSPGKHIPIVAFDDVTKPDIFVVFAYEYADSIQTKLRDFQFEYYKPIPFSKL